ncbi:MAG: hypothetical protein MRY63_05440 [Neomegalonema sp.]|nr:hypothetical protein [Neomegalonema sp.]
MLRPTGENALVGLRIEPGASGRGGIITFGHGFRRGDWPKGRSLSVLKGDAKIAAQADIKTRWPDGSVRHAVISLALPDAARAYDLALYHAPLAIEQRLSVKDLLEGRLDLVAEVTLDGRRYLASSEQLLAHGIAQPWLSGPLVSETRLEQPLTRGLRISFDLRAGKDGGLRAAVGLHTDDLEGGNRTRRYDLRLLVNDREVLRRDSVSHHHHARWREVISLGTAPADAHIVFDPAYMVATALIPPYDLGHRARRAKVERLSERLALRPETPFSQALIEPNMPNTGYRDDLGLLPSWGEAWITVQSAEALRVLRANAEAAGTIPWHFRDEATGKPAVLADHPRAWWDYRASEGNNGNAPVDYGRTGWDPDIAHQPSLSYLPYLISGDRWYLEQLQHQAAWNVLAVWPDMREGLKGLDPLEQVRAKGWGLRTLGYAAALSPDGDPLKPYFAQIIANRLEELRQSHILNGNRGAPLGSELSGWVEGYVDGPLLKTFMQDFYLMGLLQIALLDMAEAEPLADWMSGFFAGRYLQDAFDPIHGNLYELWIADESNRRFMSWRQMAAQNLAKGNFTRDQGEFFGYPTLANGFAAGHRGAMAMLAGVIAHPRAAEAFGYVASQTRGMNEGADSFEVYGQWALAPLFADGTTLQTRDHRFGGKAADRLKGTGRNELLFGDAGDDRLSGQGGNDFVIGWDGDDELETGDGFDRVAGGRGNDVIRLGGGVNHASGGPGADLFVIEDAAARHVIHDFDPANDRISLPAASGGAGDDGAGGTLFALPAGGTLRLIGAAPSLLPAGAVTLR